MIPIITKKAIIIKLQFEFLHFIFSPTTASAMEFYLKKAYSQNMLPHTDTQVC